MKSGTYKLVVLTGVCVGGYVVWKKWGPNILAWFKSLGPSGQTTPPGTSPGGTTPPTTTPTNGGGTFDMSGLWAAILALLGGGGSPSAPLIPGTPEAAAAAAAAAGGSAQAALVAAGGATATGVGKYLPAIVPLYLGLSPQAPVLVGAIGKSISVGWLGQGDYTNAVRVDHKNKDGTTLSYMMGTGPNKGRFFDLHGKEITKPV